MRPAQATLSTENLIHNIDIIKKQSQCSKIIAMVKANAYGHGIRSVGLRLQKYVDMLGVASLDEALILRSVGVTCPILLAYGCYTKEEIDIAINNKCDIAITSYEQYNDLIQELIHIQKPVSVWIKIDTGLGRLGISTDQLEEIYDNLLQNPYILKPIGLMSHLACSDNIDHPLNNKQQDMFDDIRKQYPNSNYSLYNSAACFWTHPQIHKNNIHNIVDQYARPGIALYGISPFNNIRGSDLGLKPVMTTTTTIVSKRYMKKGDTIGYGAAYICPQDMPIGLIAFGYGDGYPRPHNFLTTPYVMIDDKKCPIIGRVSMDIMAIDLRDACTADKGDDVLLWGEKLPIEELANASGMIPYNIIVGVQNRVKFHWI